MARGRKPLPEDRKKVVQGAYVLKVTKDYFEQNSLKKGFHSPTDYTGYILDNYVGKKLMKRRQ